MYCYKEKNIPDILLVHVHVYTCTFSCRYMLSLLVVGGGCVVDAIVVARIHAYVLLVIHVQCTCTHSHSVPMPFLL